MKRFVALLNHYLLISLVLSFITGIVLQNDLSLSDATALRGSLFFLGLSLFYPQRTPLARIVPLLITVCFLGMLHGATSSTRILSPTSLFSKITQQEDGVLTGTLWAMPLFDGKKTKVLIRVHSLRLRHQKVFFPVSGNLQLSLMGDWPPSLLPGDELVIRANLRRPAPPGNPGEFDYAKFLQEEGINVVGWIASPAHLHLLEQQDTWYHTLRFIPQRMRLTIREYIMNTLPPRQAGIYRALLIGDRAGLRPREEELFKATGIYHILAISGLHLSLVASSLFVVFYWLSRRSSSLMLHLSAKKLSLLLTIPPLCGYALLAGAGTPVLRSLIMVVLFILSFCVERRHSGFTTLSVAALIILLLNPLSLFTTSFQLSFAAVASLIIIQPRLIALLTDPPHGAPSNQTNHIRRLGRWIGAALLVSATAMIGTFPLLLSSFNRIAPMGPVANLLIEPLLCLWSLPLGLLSLLAATISPDLGTWLLQSGAMGITAAMAVANFLTTLPFSTLWLPTPSAILVLLYYLCLGSCFFSSAPRSGLLLFLIVASLFFWSPASPLRHHSRTSELVFLDVGQGSCTLLTLPDGTNALIDGGGRASQKWGVGRRVIAPYLWSRGISHLDAIIITHPDADHYNGIPFILRRFHPDTLWINGRKGHRQDYSQLLELARRLTIQIKIPAEKGQVLLAGGGALLRNIENPSPLDPTSLASSPARATNDQGLILLFTGRNKILSCLFPGDISTSVEDYLLKMTGGRGLQSTLLLAAHHGSETSNSPRFLRRLNPECIVVSAGDTRPLLFPSPRLRRYCAQEGIPLLDTAALGAITFTGDGERLIQSHFAGQGKDPRIP